MVIIRTGPLADIIHAVSAASIFDAAASASAGEAASARLNVTAAPATLRASVVSLCMVSPCVEASPRPAPIRAPERLQTLRQDHASKQKPGAKSRCKIEQLWLKRVDIG